MCSCLCCQRVQRETVYAVINIWIFVVFWMSGTFWSLCNLWVIHTLHIVPIFPRQKSVKSFFHVSLQPQPRHVTSGPLIIMGQLEKTGVSILWVTGCKVKFRWICRGGIWAVANSPVPNRGVRSSIQSSVAAQQFRHQASSLVRFGALFLISWASFYSFPSPRTVVYKSSLICISSASLCLQHGQDPWLIMYPSSTSTSEAGTLPPTKTKIIGVPPQKE